MAADFEPRTLEECGRNGWILIHSISETVRQLSLDPRKEESPGMRTELTRLLGIREPLIQAPMAGVSTPAMAAAVSNAGGLGSVPLGALPADAARAALAETRMLTDRPFAANVFVHPSPVHDPRPASC